MNLLFFQYGDYAKAYNAARAGEPESYRNQYTTVDYVASLAERFSVTVLSSGEIPHDIKLTPNLRSVRIIRERKKTRALKAILSDLNPDIMVVRIPDLTVLNYAQMRGIPCLPCFADTFEPSSGLKGLKHRLHFRKLRKSLSCSSIPCIGNHSLNASRSLITQVGLSASRVVPWDWHRITPEQIVKSAAKPPYSAFYAGSISEAKGVGDCIDAVSILAKEGFYLSLFLAGDGKANAPLEQWRQRVDKLGLTDRVTFLGLVANSEVRAYMAKHDVVLVTTRASYREGFPNTIVEGLASRTPLVVSDHPTFEGRLIDGKDCMKFENGNPESLARAIKSLIEDKRTYAALSQNAPDTIDKLNFGLEWFELIDKFLADPQNATNWVQDHCFDQIFPLKRP